MSEIIRFEMRRLFRSKSFYICGAIAFGIALINVIGALVVTKFYTATASANGMGAFVGDVASQLGYSGLHFLRQALSNANLPTILAVFVSIFVCRDYSEGTLRIVISRGYSRTSVTVANTLAVWLAGIMIALPAMGISFLLGSLFFGVGTGFNGAFMVNLFLLLFSVMAYSGFYLFLSTWFRKLASAIVGNILAPTLISLGVAIIDSSLSTRSLLNFGTYDAAEDVFQLSPYLLSDCFSSLSDPSASSGLLGSLLGEGQNTDMKSLLTRCGLVILGYLVLFFLCSLLASRKQEL